MPNGSSTKAALSTAAAPKTVRITVHSDNGNGEKKGTFTAPPPKLRVDTNQLVEWNLQVTPNDAGATFEVRFSGFSSPFNDANGDPILTVTDTSPALQAVNKALYHYSVRVNTSGGEVFTIDGCPELEVSDH